MSAETLLHAGAVASHPPADLSAPHQMPGFVIIGAQKGGTTSLYRYLTEHEQIGGASEKEVHYFDRAYRKGMDWYLRHFPRQGRFAVVGESSPSYLFIPEVAPRLREAVPNAKLIVLLRDPVSRAFSHYNMRTRLKSVEETFEQAIDEEFARLDAADHVPGPEKGKPSFIARGLYLQQLQRWLRLFPREQILVLKSEDFFARPEEGLAQALDFLGVSTAFQPSGFDRHNGASYDSLREETRARLAAYYRPHNERLYTFLGRDFGWDD